MDLAKQHQCNHLVFDIRKCKPTKTLVDAYWMMQSLESLAGLDVSYKCAIIFDPSVYPENRADFIEDVVVNRPNPPFKMFKNLDEAFEWLK